MSHESLPNDLKAAQDAAVSLASAADAIHKSLPLVGRQKLRRLVGELGDQFDERRKAILAVENELRETRHVSARFDDIVAPTAHEAAIKLIFAVNREIVASIPISIEGSELYLLEVMSDPIHNLPDARDIIAEVHIEAANAAKNRRELTCQPAADGTKSGADSEGRQQAPTQTRAAINFLEWGIGFDPTTGWHVFRFSLKGWKYLRKKLTVPTGISSHILNSLLKNHGILTKKDIFTHYEGVPVRPKKINSYLTRLRKIISAGIGINSNENINVLPKYREGASWRLEIRIGQAEKTDPDFSGADPELSFIPCE